jgi:hypothetical protein
MGHVAARFMEGACRRSSTTALTARASSASLAASFPTTASPRRAIGARGAALLEEARAALQGAPLRPEGVELLLGVADLLVNRDR